MTVVTLAFCTNVDKIKNKLDMSKLNIKYSITQIDKILIKNKKYYKFVKIILENDKLNNLFTYNVIMYNADAINYIDLRSYYCCYYLDLFLLNWKFVIDHNWDIDMTSIFTDCFEDKLILAKYHKQKANLNYVIQTNEKTGTLFISGEYISDKKGIYDSGISFYLKDDIINSFMLLNNLLIYFTKNYNINNKIVNNIEININYNNYKNYKKMNVIKTCLPISTFMQNMFYEKHLKLHKKIRTKIIKIIHVLNYFGLYKNIISKIV